MFVLVAFNVFVLDYGVMWVAREQAQNAADAGALAGAVARSYDDLDPTPGPGGETAGIAKATAAANTVWNEAATADVESFDCPPGVDGRCVRVDVYRDGTHGHRARRVRRVRGSAGTARVATPAQSPASRGT